MMLELGDLVRSKENSLGAGKITEIGGSTVEIKYFCSVGQSITKTVPLSSVAKIRLQRQTRCYIWSELQESWLIGRIYGWDESLCQYQIDLPEGESILASDRDLEVRCNLPIKDPIEVLAMKGHETPYFHNQRSRFVRCLVEQRAVSRGMTGLLSANIELFPHQVEVVRRVLEDPIQRYLLADEVGLGKTIEAGIILRQYLLDEPQGRALVIVPPYLVEQWRQELEEKFYASHFGDRVRVLTVSELNQKNLQGGFGFVIIDEAHNIAAMARFSDLGRQRAFQTCKRLAHESDRLLLLSATPVVNHERDFLTMLHLLDPITYQLNDLEGFRSRVQKRQEIGHVLLALKEDATSIGLKTQLSHFKTLFAEDQPLLTLMEKLENSLELEEVSAQPEKIVQAIRTHISETYRLHRRMIRNRRAAVEDVLFDRNAIPKAEYDLDERSYSVHELLEEWRTAAPNEDYRRIFLLLFRASSTWWGIFKDVVEARLKKIYQTELVREFGAEDVRLLATVPHFPKEEEILQSLLKVLQEPSEDGDRLELLKIVLLYHLSELLGLQSYQRDTQKLLERVQQRIARPFSNDRFPKLIIFTSFVKTCAELVQYLSKTFGEQSVVGHQFGTPREQIEQNITKFKTDPKCFLLVCDFSGEEGRNLQFAEGSIHFDLPWSPNRLEQRLGRLDRIGGKMKIQSWLLAGPDVSDSPQEAWYQLLKDGFKIFDQSIASLQFYVDEQLTILEETLFRSGAAGLVDRIATIQSEIQGELIKVREQQVLDEIEIADDYSTQYFQALENYDNDRQHIQKATEAWMCNALQFRRLIDPNFSEVYRYLPTERTLLPANQIRDLFSHVHEPGTYNRRFVNNHSGIDLYRIGSRTIEQLASYIRWDDRGQAFALWRCDQSWDTTAGQEWVGFRFDYAIEADLSEVQQVLKNEQSERLNFNKNALRRRADALFPPQMQTIFLNAQMEIVEDAALLKILQRSYFGKNSDDRDYNLAKERLPILNQFIDADQWATVCRQARLQSENVLRQQPAFIQLCEQRSKSAILKLENQLDRLQWRATRLADIDRMSHLGLAHEIETEKTLIHALLKGIQNPFLRLDSVGFMIVSGRSPDW